MPCDAFTSALVTRISTYGQARYGKPVMASQLWQASYGKPVMASQLQSERIRATRPRRSYRHGALQQVN